jgi:hypothetical protein
MRISEIRDPQQFQILCQSLLCAEYEDTQIVRDSNGDGGIDAYVPSTQTLYAMYCPENSPTSKSYYQRKISSDLAKASKLSLEKGYSITRWVFLTPTPLEEELHRYLREKVSNVGFVEGLNQSELHLQYLLLKHPSLRSQFPQLILNDIASKIDDLSSEIRRKDADSISDKWKLLKGKRVRLSPIYGLPGYPPPDTEFLIREATDSEVIFRKMVGGYEPIILPLECLSAPWGMNNEENIRATIKSGELRLFDIGQGYYQWEWNPL